MRYPQVLVYEVDGRIATLLRNAPQTKERFTGSGQTWSLREPRHRDTCLRLLQRGGPNLLILKVEEELDRILSRSKGPLLEEEARRRLEAAVERNFALLGHVTQFYPETATVVVGEAANAGLAGLAWDLGASYVLFPPLTWDHLPDLVTGLLDAAIRTWPQAEAPR